MKFKDLQIILPTCDKYMPVMELMAYTIEKYWKDHQPITLVGYEPPEFDLPDNWTFISMGKDTGYKCWGGDMLQFFKGFEDEYFIYKEDDRPLIDYTDMVFMEDMYNLMVDDDKIKKCIIGGSHMPKPYRWDVIDENLAYLKPGAEYQITRGDDIWDTKYFTSFLREGKSGADFEVNNLRHQDGMKKLLCIKRPPLICSHLFVRSGQFNHEGWNWCDYIRSITLRDEDKPIFNRILKNYGL